MRAKVLLIGLGSVATHAHEGGHLRQYLEDPLIEVVGGVDPDPAARSRALQLGLPRAFTTFQDALAAAEFGYVSVLTPTILHADACKTASTFCKHILCEKPLAASLSQAEDIRKHVREAGVACTVSMNLRFLPLSRRIREDFASGLFGEVFFIDLDECSGFNWSTFGYRRSLVDPISLVPFWGDPAAHSLQRVLILDKVVHFLDLLMFWTGSTVTSIYAQAGSQGRYLEPGENLAALQLVLQSGTRCRLFHSWGSHHDDRVAGSISARIRILGSEASAICESQSKNSDARYEVYREGGLVRTDLFPVTRRTDYADAFKHLVHISQSRQRDYAELDQAVEVMKIVESAYESLSTGSVIAHSARSQETHPPCRYE
jgi:predicted dehydrogenase